MKLTKLIRIVVIGALVGKAIVYGSTKNTNLVRQVHRTRPALTSALSATEVGRDRRIAPLAHGIAAWTTRGAWDDWEEIEFPEGFRFPFGLESLDRITLLSQGEVRRALRDVEAIALLPTPLAIVPGVSSVSHGLTDSGSYLFAWNDGAPNRETSVLASASVELLPSGESIVRYGETTVTNAVLRPVGFVGNGQDANWIRGNFAFLQSFDSSLTNADEIISLGYDNWLTTRAVGIDQENGIYKAAITINQQPATNNQQPQPIYLVCGPYKVNVTEPGTYRFPLEIFDEYTIQAYPETVQFTVAFDDGYTGDEASYEIVETPTAVRGRAASMRPPQSRSAPPQTTPNPFSWKLRPIIIVTPNVFDLADVVGKRFKKFANAAHQRFVTTIEGLDIAVNQNNFHTIRAAQSAGYAQWYIDHPDEVIYNGLTVREVFDWPDPNSTNRTDAAFFTGETYYAVTNGPYAITALTAATETGTTNAVNATATLQLPEGQSCAVGVFMGTAEPVERDYENDWVEWHVTSNAGPGFEGTATVAQHAQSLQAARRSDHCLYETEYGVILLAGQRYDCPSGGHIVLSLMASAKNNGDGLRQSAIQIVVFPVVNGNVLGKPEWINL